MRTVKLIRINVKEVAMPGYMKVVKVGNKYCTKDVKTGKGKTKGRCFSSKAKAIKQMQAINLTYRRKLGLSVPKKKGK